MALRISEELRVKMNQSESKNINAALGVVLSASLVAAFAAGPVAANEMCASADQAQQVQEFYAANAGTMPTIAARKLNMPEAVVVSGLAAGQSVSTGADAFPEIWALMNTWEPVTFLITKGSNIFEIASSVGIGTPSETSDYFNVAYEQPLRGHLRPDLYASITAVALPREDGDISRGVLFYDQDGASVFGAFMASKIDDAEAAKFSAVVELMKAKTPACPDS